MDHKAYFEEILATSFADEIEAHLQSKVDRLNREIRKREEDLRISERDFEDSDCEMRFKIEIDDLNNEVSNLKNNLIKAEDRQRYWQLNKTQIIDEYYG